MGGLRRVASALGRVLVRGLEVGLAALVLLSLWLLGQVPTGPDVPEQAGTFTWAFLLAWLVASLALVVLAGAHLLVAAYRSWTAASGRRLRRPVGRLAGEAVLGTAVVALVPPSGSPGGPGLLLAPAVLAWAVIVHHAVDAARFGRDRLGGE